MASSDELRRTVAGHEFGQTASPAPISPTAAADQAAGPELGRPSVAEHLRRLGLPVPPARPRFALDAVLGVGATARVFAARDNDLARPVAVKLLAAETGEDVRRFVDEARITASLEHPNVLPVHDIDIDARGRVYFTMKRIEGRSLGSALDASSRQRREPPLDDLNALVSVFIGVCQALAYAHRRRIVHQDVKPDNIMLGAFGEVLLVDWGSATSLDDPEQRLYGTPLYMSPEQARRERADERSDVYCVGATLFHALTLRLPTWDDDPEEFWRQKRQGLLTPPSDEERRSTPPALLAIALKALSADPAARYRDGADLLEDLRRYQGGLAVSALREGWLQRFGRWHRRNARVFWSWSAAAAVILALGGMVYGDRIEELARWGSPIPSGSFADDSWREHWAVRSGDFTRVEGGIATATNRDNIVVLKRHLRGAVAIEYDAEASPERRRGDLSLIWARDLRWSDDRAKVVGLVDDYIAHVGGWDGAFTTIARHENPESPERCLAYDSFRPERGRRYHIRVEIVEHHLSLSVDGVLRCAWEDAYSLEGGYVALYGVYLGKSFTNIRIFEREVPRKVPATAIGDSEARAHQFDLAASEYGRVADSNRGEAMGQEARYKEGMCLWRAGHRPEAHERWKELAGTAYAPLTRLFEIQELYEQRHLGKALNALTEVARAGDGPRHLAALQWGQWIEDIAKADPGMAGEWLDRRDREFAHETAVDQNAANALLTLERYGDLLSRYPEQRLQCCQALMGLGRYREVVDGYEDQLWLYNQAAFHGGFFDRINPEDSIGLLHEAMWMRGDIDDALAAATSPDERMVYCHALRVAGRFDEILRDFPDIHRDRALVLCATGRAAVAAASADPEERLVAALATGEVQPYLSSTDWPTVPVVHAIAAVKAYADGRVADARALAPTDRRWHVLPYEATVTCSLLIPTIEASLAGRPELVDRAYGEIEREARWANRQVPWHLASYALGHIDDQAFLAQPVRVFAPALLHLAKALREDHRGHAGEATAEYRAFLATPPLLRSESLDYGWIRFCEWRIAKLAR